MRADNPVRGVRLFQPEKRERFLSADEFAALGTALNTAEKQGVNVKAINAIRLLALTGCRKAEILNLKWEYVDSHHKCLRLPDSKTGAKVVPLGQAAFKLLSKVKPVQDNPFVFAGTDGKHFVGLQKIWTYIRSKAGLDGVRLHDLRHSFASVGVADGLSLPIIGKVLGHTQTRTTQRYAHLGDDPVREAVNSVAKSVNQALSRKPKNSIKRGVGHSRCSAAA